MREAWDGDEEARVRDLARRELPAAVDLLRGRMDRGLVTRLSEGDFCANLLAYLRGRETPHGPVPVGGGINQPTLETGVVLYQNAPHPIRMGSRTMFRYFIPAAELAKSQGAPVEIRIYGLAGQHLATLTDPTPWEGLNERLAWNGRDKNGRQLGEGIYSYTLVVNGRMYTQRLMIVK